MTATNHVITGAIIGAAIHQPLLALSLAFISHFVLDSLPHFGGKELLKNKRKFLSILGTDVFAASLVLIGIAITQPDNWPLILACAILAASPDLMWFSHFVRDMRNRPKRPFNIVERFHSRIQWGERLWGWPIEIAWFACALPVFIRLAY